MLKAVDKDMYVRKRDGRVVPFERGVIASAIQRAFMADKEVTNISELDGDLLKKIELMTDVVVWQVSEDAQSDQGVAVERIQDLVEDELMRQQYFKVAKRYIVYRAEHEKIRRLQADEQMESPEPFPAIMVNRDESLENFNARKLRQQIEDACRGYEESCSAQILIEEVQKQLYNGIVPKEIGRAMVLAARSRIENDPSYDNVAGRLQLNIIYRESLGKRSGSNDLAQRYLKQFKAYIDLGIENQRISPELATFDLERLAHALVPERDELFPYLGLQTNL